MDNDHDDRGAGELRDLCTTLAELSQRIEGDLAQASNGAAIDYAALDQRVADVLGEIGCGRTPRVSRA